MLLGKSSDHEAIIEQAAEQETKPPKEEGNSIGINKGGLVSNKQNHGQTEVVDITNNIYYESSDLVGIKGENDEINDKRKCMNINKGGLVSNNHNHGETEVLDVTDNIYYESVDLDAI